ncbi:MAG: hypothetical protein WC744_00170 [Patescibacteria group bacterium]|jgi:hypothetical protein
MINPLGLAGCAFLGLMTGFIFGPKVEGNLNLNGENLNKGQIVTSAALLLFVAIPLIFGLEGAAFDGGVLCGEAVHARRNLRNTNK